MATHLSFALPLPKPFSSDRPTVLVDYRTLATIIVTHVRKALDGASLAWRQLSRLRFFYGSRSVEEPLLRETVAEALPPEAEGIARTFVPVPSLLFDTNATNVVGVVRVQVVALDLERLRTEAWVHEVPDGGI